MCLNTRKRKLNGFFQFNTIFFFNHLLVIAIRSAYGSLFTKFFFSTTMFNTSKLALCNFFLPFRKDSSIYYTFILDNICSPSRTYLRSIYLFYFFITLHDSTTYILGMCVYVCSFRFFCTTNIISSQLVRMLISNTYCFTLYLNF